MMMRGVMTYGSPSLSSPDPLAGLMILNLSNTAIIIFVERHGHVTKLKAFPWAGAIRCLGDLMDPYFDGGVARNTLNNKSMIVSQASGKRNLLQRVTERSVANYVFLVRG